MRQEQCELLVAACHTRLEAAADPARAAEAAKFFPSNPPILGVPTGLTNTLGKELIERLKHDGSLDDIIAVAEALFASGIMEEGSCANTVLAAFWRRFMPQHWDTFERWLGLFNCWGTTDSFGLKVLGPLVLRDGPPSERLRTWSRSSHVWTRRASMVSLVPAARKGGHVDLILEITDALLADPQDAIQKAVGWMLKELCKGDVQAVVTYLAGRRECMARLAFRYASEKLTPAQKAWLLEQSAG